MAKTTRQAKAGGKQVRKKAGTSAEKLRRSSAEIQKQTRKAHSRERAEDYVEAIADLISRKGEARAVDLADSLGVTHVTVIRTVQRLQREGLVTTEPYRSIFLTNNGKKLATQSRNRHETVQKFLIAIGVPPEIAAADAEGIEHHVSPDTLLAFERFLASPSAPVCPNTRQRGKK